MEHLEMTKALRRNTSFEKKKKKRLTSCSYHYLILFAFDNEGELRFDWTVMSIVEVNTETMLRLSSKTQLW